MILLNVVLKDKIAVPKALQQRTVQWYHDILCHPGQTRTEATIAQHFYWKNMRKDVERVCSTCPICQINKRNKKKYGHLPEKVEDDQVPTNIAVFLPDLSWGISLNPSIQHV